MIAMEYHIGKRKIKMQINKTPYFGLGIIIAPKTKKSNGHVIINIFIWEININWGNNE